MDEYCSEDFFLREILPKLPMKSVTRFKSVSKSWLAYISSDSFIANHFHHHSALQNPSHITHAGYIDDEEDVSKLFIIGPDDSNPVEIDMSDITIAQSDKIQFFYPRGSSNGLLYIQQFFDYEDDKRYNILLWNPATREFKNLPKPIDHRVCEDDDHRLGFGKDCYNYKIVRVAIIHRGSETNLEAQLFTRNTGCWRNLGVQLDFQRIRSEGAVIGDSIHWSVLRGDESDFKILTFDLNTEELKVNNSPVHGSDIEYDYLDIFKWKGSLGAFATTVDQKKREFWVKNSETWCWTKMLVMEEPMCRWYCRGIFRDQFLLFDFRDRKDILFDPVTNAQKRFEDEFDIVCYNFDHYLPSLISPSY